MKTKHEQEVEKGRIEFERRFIEHNPKEFSIEWDVRPDFDTGNYKFHVLVNGKRVPMSVDENDLADFGAGGPKEFRIVLLNKKLNELSNKLKKL